MSRRDTMRDPRYSPILLQIERILHAADASASARGVTLTDSNVRSLLVRTINNTKGKTAKSAETAASEKDRVLADVLCELVAVRAAVVERSDRSHDSVERRPLSASDRIAALQAIKDSCAVRTGREPGSRIYLEFLRDFLKDADRAE